MIIDIGRGHLRQTFTYQIGNVLKKGKVKGIKNRRACMNVNEAKELCQDRNKWRLIASAFSSV